MTPNEADRADPLAARRAPQNDIAIERGESGTKVMDDASIDKRGSRKKEMEESMKKFALVALAAIALMAAPAYAQMQAADQTASQSAAMPDNGYHQNEMTVVGKIASIDFSQGTLTLDNGMQFTLPQSFQFTSSPQVGQDVQVTYDQQGGLDVIRVIDVGGTNSHTGTSQ